MSTTMTPKMRAALFRSLSQPALQKRRILSTTSGLELSHYQVEYANKLHGHGVVGGINTVVVGTDAHKPNLVLMHGSKRFFLFIGRF
jgi:hypothetical protein